MTSAETAPVVPAPEKGALRSQIAKWLWTLVFLAALFYPAYGFADNQFRTQLLCRCLVLALFALGVDLVWGYTGLLSLGQALYFGLGAYMMAYSLKLKQAAAAVNGVPGEVAPDFMAYTALSPTHPDYVPPPALQIIAPLANIWVALALAILLPTIVATIFGWIAFRRKIRGVYFSLITQALVLAVFLL